MRLLDYAKNVYSQTGEDGVLAAVLDKIGAKDKWCVEFGAWDGQHFSNTCNLIDNAGYSAVLIEGNRERFQDLLKRHGKNPKVFALNRLVGFNQNDGLDSLLANVPIPKDFDLLSIDIDGNDYHVWSALSAYIPKVVCIEFNPTIPTELDFIQRADPTVTQGASLLALTRLANQKGYELVAVTAWNAIFVRSEYFQLFQIANNQPAALREDVSTVTHIFCGYDGKIFLSGHGFLPWHGLRYSGRVRQIPRIFRKYPDEFGFLTRRAYAIYKKLLKLLKRL
jgi:hypothetical protein